MPRVTDLLRYFDGSCYDSEVKVLRLLDELPLRQCRQDGVVEMRRYVERHGVEHPRLGYLIDRYVRELNERRMRTAQRCIQLQHLSDHELRKCRAGTTFGKRVLDAEWSRRWDLYKKELRAARASSRPSVTYSVFRASNSARTGAHLKRLESLGLTGEIAAELFRVLKASVRAKDYVGSPWGGAGTSYSRLAYGRKAAALNRLVHLLQEDGHGLNWGWGNDSEQSYAEWVIYVDLPSGQVGFHSPKRIGGPDYGSIWDGAHENVSRICEFCDNLLDEAERGTEEQD